MSRLDPELLFSVEIISSVDLFNKKLIRTNTSLLYKQQRYNLLREDSEGFSKMIYILERFGRIQQESKSKEEYETRQGEIIEEISSTIGKRESQLSCAHPFTCASIYLSGNGGRLMSRIAHVTHVMAH